MTLLDDLVGTQMIAADWGEALQPVAVELEHVWQLVEQQRSEYESGAGPEILPASVDVFAAFRRPLAEIRVVVLGQDPYPTPGHAVGLSFSTHPKVRPLPRSLANVFRELSDDLGVIAPNQGDLSAWADQGVCLLNRVLTVQANNVGSHRKLGWEPITRYALRVIAERGTPLVAVLWGNDARSMREEFSGIHCIESAHPSPLSASRGFFGSQPFSQINEALVEQESEPIAWGADTNSDQLW